MPPIRLTPLQSLLLRTPGLSYYGDEEDDTTGAGQYASKLDEYYASLPPGWFDTPTVKKPKTPESSPFPLTDTGEAGDTSEAFLRTINRVQKRMEDEGTPVRLMNIGRAKEKKGGEAADFGFLVDGKTLYDDSQPWERLAKVAKEEGLSWGGKGHVEYGVQAPKAETKAEPPKAGEKSKQSSLNEWLGLTDSYDDQKWLESVRRTLRTPADVSGMKTEALKVETVPTKPAPPRAPLPSAAFPAAGIPGGVKPGPLPTVAPVPPTVPSPRPTTLPSGMFTPRMMPVPTPPPPMELPAGMKLTEQGLQQPTPPPQLQAPPQPIGFFGGPGMAPPPTPAPAPLPTRPTAELPFAARWYAQNLPQGELPTTVPQELAPPEPQVPGVTLAKGQLVPGNIDLYAQPKVKNKDGTISTVDSFSVDFDGKEYLLPTVTPDGRHLSQPDAIKEFQKTGRHLGIFDSPKNATAYAKQLHEDYAAGKYDVRPTGPLAGEPGALTPEQQRIAAEITAKQAQQPFATPKIPPVSKTPPKPEPTMGPDFKQVRGFTEAFTRLVTRDPATGLPMLSKEGEQLIPFVGSAVETMDLVNVIAAARRLREGKYEPTKPSERISQKAQDEATVNAFFAQREAEGGPTTRWFKIANTVENLPGFAIEFMMTGGAYATANEATVTAMRKGLLTMLREAAERSAGKIVKEGAEAVAEEAVNRSVKTLAQEGLGWAVGSAAQTAANLPRLAASTAGYMAPPQPGRYTAEEAKANDQLNQTIAEGNQLKPQYDAATAALTPKLATFRQAQQELDAMKPQVDAAQAQATALITARNQELSGLHGALDQAQAAFAAHRQQWEAQGKPMTGMAALQAEQAALSHQIDAYNARLGVVQQEIGALTEKTRAVTDPYNARLLALQQQQKALAPEIANVTGLEAKMRAISERAAPLQRTLSKANQKDLHAYLQDWHDDNFWTALGKGYGAQFVEIGSERTGELPEEIAKALKPVYDFLKKTKGGTQISKAMEPVFERLKPTLDAVAGVKAAILDRWLRLSPNNTLAKAMEMLKKGTAWNGWLGEIFEERVGDVMRDMQPWLRGEGEPQSATTRLFTGQARGPEEPNEQLSQNARYQAAKDLWQQLLIEGPAFAAPEVFFKATKYIVPGQSTTDISTLGDVSQLPVEELKKMLDGQLAIRSQITIPPLVAAVNQRVAAITAAIEQKTGQKMPPLGTATPAAGEAAATPGGTTATTAAPTTVGDEIAKVAAAIEAFSQSPASQGLTPGTPEHEAAFATWLQSPEGQQATAGPTTAPTTTETTPTPTPTTTPATTTPVTRFTTSQGSQYTVDGQTTRRFQTATGTQHSASDRTVYLDPDTASRTQALINTYNDPDGPTTARPNIDVNGNVVILVKDRDTGKIRSDLSRRVMGTDTPAVGLHPFEVWKKDPETGERRWHFGNAITNVEGGEGGEAPTTPTAPTGETTPAATPTAVFAFHQPDETGQNGIPMFHVQGGPLDGSTVSADTLRQHGIEVPEAPEFVPRPETPSTPPSTTTPSGTTPVTGRGEGRPTDEQMRDALLAAMQEGSEEEGPRWKEGSEKDTPDNPAEAALEATKDAQLQRRIGIMRLDQQLATLRPGTPAHQQVSNARQELQRQYEGVWREVDTHMDGVDTSALHQEIDAAATAAVPAAQPFDPAAAAETLSLERDELRAQPLGSAVSAIADMQEVNGLFPANRFTPAEQEAIEATGIPRQSTTSEEGNTVEGYSEQQLWAIRKAYQARHAAAAKARKAEREAAEKAAREAAAKPPAAEEKPTEPEAPTTPTEKPWAEMTREERLAKTRAELRGEKPAAPAETPAKTEADALQEERARLLEERARLIAELREGRGEPQMMAAPGAEAPGLGREKDLRLIHDPNVGNVFTALDPAQVELITQHPAVRRLVDAVHQAFAVALDSLPPDERAKVGRIGVMLFGAYGVTDPQASGKFDFYFNPLHPLLTEQTPDFAAAIVYHAFMHEVTHLRKSGEDRFFSYHVGQSYGRAGATREQRALGLLREAYRGKGRSRLFDSGGLAADVTRPLRDYEALAWGFGDQIVPARGTRRYIGRPEDAGGPEGGVPEGAVGDRGEAVEPSEKEILTVIDLIDNYAKEGIADFAAVVQQFQTDYGPGARALDRTLEVVWRLSTGKTASVADVLPAAPPPPPVTEPEPAKPETTKKKEEKPKKKEEPPRPGAIDGLQLLPAQVFDRLRRGQPVSPTPIGTIVEQKVQDAWERGFIKSTDDVRRIAEMPQGTYEGYIQFRQRATEYVAKWGGTPLDELSYDELREALGEEQEVSGPGSYWPLEGAARQLHDRLFAEKYARDEAEREADEGRREALSDADKTAYGALHSFEGSARRWRLRRITGLSDEALEKAVSEEFGISGGGSGYGGYGQDHKGGKNPSLTIRKGDEETKYTGKKLLALVRRLLDIPEPTGEALPEEPPGRRPTESIDASEDVAAYRYLLDRKREATHWDPDEEYSLLEAAVAAIDAEPTLLQAMPVQDLRDHLASIDDARAETGRYALSELDSDLPDYETSADVLDRLERALDRELKRREGQQELLLEEEPEAAPPEEAEAPPVISFRSGNQTAPADVVGFIKGGQDVGVVAIGTIGSVRAALVEHVKGGGNAFIDSGAFGKTVLDENDRGVSTINFDAVISNYNKLADDVGEDNVNGLFVVAPDVAPLLEKGKPPRSFPEETKAIQDKYADQIKALLDRGLRVIVPVQVGPNMAARAVEVLQQFPGAMIGLPGNQKAISDDQLGDMLRAIEEGVDPQNVGGFHFLGIGSTNRRRERLIANIRKTFPGATITTDATRSRALFGRYPSGTLRAGSAVAEAIFDKRVRDVMEEMEDETELLAHLYHNELDGFTDAELDQIADALGTTLSKLQQWIVDGTLDDLVDPRLVDSVIFQIAYARAAATIEAKDVRREAIERVEPKNAEERNALIDQILAYRPTEPPTDPDALKRWNARWKKLDADTRRWLQSLSDEELAAEAAHYAGLTAEKAAVSQPAVSRPAEPIPTVASKAEIQATFNLTPEEAEVADILRQLGLVSPDSMLVARGGTPGEGALEQRGKPAEPRGYRALEEQLLTPEERVRRNRNVKQALLDVFRSLPRDVDWTDVAIAGKAAREWYRRSAVALAHVFGDETPRFVALLAALSPRIQVQQNLERTVRMWLAWKALSPEDRVKRGKILQTYTRVNGKLLSTYGNNMVEALTAEDPLSVRFSGPKVHSFARNLLGHMQDVTNDVWMAFFSGIEQATLGGKKTQTGPGKTPAYLAVSAKTRRAAVLLTQYSGETWTPAQVQAAIWGWTQTLYLLAKEEGVRAIDVLRSGKMTDALLASSVVDFSKLLSTNATTRDMLEAAGYGSKLATLEAVLRRAPRPRLRATGTGRAGEGEGDFGPTLGEQRAARRLDAIIRQRRAQGLSEDPLEQRAAGGELQGTTEFLADSRAIVRGYQSANFSTFVHELFHVIRRQRLNRDVAEELRGGVTDEDIARFERWAGVKDGVWTKEAEEKVARAFERWLRDGQILTHPSIRDNIRSVFQSAKDWMSKIYQQIQGSPLDIEVPKEISDGFAKLFGIEAPPATARNAVIGQAIQDFREELDRTGAARHEGVDVKLLRDTPDSEYRVQITRAGQRTELPYAYTKAGNAINAASAEVFGKDWDTWWAANKPTPSEPEPTAAPFTVGQQVRFRGEQSFVGIPAGTVGTVTSVNPSGQVMQVRIGTRTVAARFDDVEAATTTAPAPAPASTTKPTKKAEQLSEIEQERERLKAKQAQIVKDIKSRLGRIGINTPADPELLLAVIKLARNYIDQKILDFREAALMFRNDFGEDPEAEGLFELAWPVALAEAQGTPLPQAIKTAKQQQKQKKLPTVAAAVTAYNQERGTHEPEGGGHRAGGAEPGGGTTESVRDGGTGPLGTLPPAAGATTEGAGAAGTGRGGEEGVPPGAVSGEPTPATEPTAEPGAGGGAVSGGSLPTSGTTGGGVAGPVGIRGEKPADYTLTPERIAAIIGRGNVQRFADNVAAIRLLKELQADHRYATPAEQDILAKYVGWGATDLAQYLEDTPRRAWSKNERALWEELRSLTTPEQRRGLIESSPNAHFTFDIYKPIWSALQWFGFTGGRVLEPSVGVGHALGFMPVDIRSKSIITASELDPTTAAMAGYLYPSARVQATGFEKIRLPRNTQDLAISNVPFGRFGVADKLFSGFRFVTEKIHSYFFAKALEMVRPGGYVVFITSRYTMDGPEHLNIRRYLMEKAHFIGAVRLPGGEKGAFAKSADTQVTTDLIILQKKVDPTEEARNADLFTQSKLSAEFSTPERKDWRGRTIPAKNVYRSAWWDKHPQFILGTEGLTGTRYGPDEYNVEAHEGENLHEALENALKVILPQNAYQPATTSSTAPNAPVLDPNTFKPGELRVGPQNTIQRALLDGTLIDATPKKPNGDVDVRMVQRVVGLIGIRDLRRAVVDAMRSATSSEDDIKKAQGKLLRAYNRFVKEFGDLNNDTNRRAFRSDPEAAAVRALEVLKTTAKVSTDKHGKEVLRIKHEVDRLADIFTKRTINPTPQIDHVDTPKDALLVSLGTRARIDWPFMARITRNREVTPERLADLSAANRQMRLSRGARGGTLAAEIAALQQKLKDEGLVFEAPDGTWVIKDEYLSGDVVTKLEEARIAADEEPERFATNIAALEAIQPVPKTADQIQIALGVHWVEPTDLARFVDESLGEDGTVMRLDGSEVYVRWTGVYPDDVLIAANRHALAVRYGEDNEKVYGFTDLLDDALNLKIPELGYYVRDRLTGKSTFVKQEQQTIAARANIEELRALWSQWVNESPDVLERIVDVYNTRYNRTVKREYDGSHMVNYANEKGEAANPEQGGVRTAALPGLELPFTLYPHQLRAIWRILTSGNTLLAHEVGAGKTFEMIAAAMEMRRTGRARKPMITVPTYLLAQWRKDIQRAYPTAKLLAFEEKDLGKENRQVAMAQIAHGDWDIVLVPHSSFELLKVSQERMADTLNEWVAEAMGAEAEARARYGQNDPTVKKLEEQRRRIEDKVRRLLERADKGEDKALTWEDLGVDALMVDEAHAFKNLYFFSKMDTIRGISRSNADKSLDLFIKIKDINESSNYRNLVFATATPVMNTLAEVYTMQRYLQPQRLRELGFENFDNWYLTFAQAKAVTEQKPDGSYHEVMRVAKFRNGKLLHRIIADVMDYVGWEDMPYLKLPKLKDNKITVVQGEPHPMYDILQKWFGERLAAIRALPPHWNKNTQEYIAPDRYHPITKRRMMSKTKIGEPAKDNILTVMGDAKLAAIDARLVLGEHAKDVATSRLQSVAKSVADYYKREAKNKGVALVFLDVGTPPADSIEPLEFLKGVKIEDTTGGDALGTEAEETEDEDTAALASSDTEGEFNLYEGLKKALIARGLKSHEIAFIHQARNAAERLALFQAAQEGKVRVLIASTDKGALGMNIQDRLGLIVEFDAPRAMRPGDIRQRHGRGIRQGNSYPEIDIQRHVTKGTTDEWLYGLLGKKQGMITDFMRGELDEYEDDDPTTMSLEEAEIRATNDPRKIELLTLKSSLPRLEAQATSAERAVAAAQSELAQDRAILPGRLKALERITEWVRDHFQKLTGENFTITIGDQAITKRADANVALVNALKPLAEHALTLDQHGPSTQDRRQVVGTYGGLPIFAMSHVNRFTGDREVKLYLDADAAGEGDLWVGDIGVRKGADGKLAPDFAEGRNLVISVTDRYNRLEKLPEQFQYEVDRVNERIAKALKLIEHPPDAPRKLAAAKARIEAIENELRRESAIKDAEAQRALREAELERARRRQEEGEEEGEDDTAQADRTESASDQTETAPSDRTAASAASLPPQPGPQFPVTSARDPVTGAPINAIEPPELVTEIAEVLQTTPKVVKQFRGEGIRGQWSEGGIRLHRDLFKPENIKQLAATLAHEIGHLVDWLPDHLLTRGNMLGHLRSLKKFISGTFTAADGSTIKDKDVRAELLALSTKWRPWNPATASKSFIKYRKSATELYADAISVLLVNPGMLEAEAPIFFKQFFEHLDRKPDVAAAFFSVWDLMAGDREELVERRLEGLRKMFAEGNAKGVDMLRQRIAAREINRKDYPQHLMHLMANQVDKHAPFIYMLQADKRKGLVTKEEENPFYVLSERTYTLGSRPKTWLQRHIQPMMTALADNGISWIDFGSVLFLQRIAGGDRKVANPKNFTEPAAMEALEHLLSKMTPEQRRLVLDSAKALRAAVKEVVKEGYDEGLYTDEQWERVNDNQYYSTFRTIDHMEDPVSSRIIQQFGTLKKIDNPADETILKTIVTIRAIEHQKAKRTAFEYLMARHPKDIKDAEVRPLGRGREEILEPTGVNAHLRLVTYMVNGKLKGKYVDPYIADSLNNRSVELNHVILRILMAPNKVFRKIFTTWNPGFMGFNLFRDFMRTWKNTPNMPLWKLFRRYYQAVPLARLRAFGLPEKPTAQQLQTWEDLLTAQDKGIFGTTFNDQIRGETIHDQQILNILAKQGVGAFAEQKRNPFIRMAFRLADAVGNANDFIETLPKAAVMYEFKGKGSIEDITPEQRQFIRTKVGSPDFLAGGTWTPVTNNLFLFSNAILQAWRSDFQIVRQAVRHPTTQSGFIWKTTATNVVPKVLTMAALLAAAGAAGGGDDKKPWVRGIARALAKIPWLAEAGRLLRRATRYDLTNYIPIPLGEDSKGNTVYLRLPQDDSGRFIGALTWKALEALVDDRDESIFRTIADVVDYTQGQLPSMNPTIEVAADALQYARGKNIYDPYRGNYILTEDEQKARFAKESMNLDALGKFVGWELQQMGVTLVYKFYSGMDGSRPRTTSQQILDGKLPLQTPLGPVTYIPLPFVSNIAGRFLRITNYGEVERLREPGVQVAAEEAAERQAVNKAVATKLAQYQRLPPAEQNVLTQYQYASQIQEELHPDVTDPQKRAVQLKKIQTKMRLSAIRGEVDPLSDVVLSATSNEQKLADILAARRDMTPEVFEQWLREASSQGVVSGPLLVLIRREQAKRMMVPQ